ncbi:peptidase M23 [Lentzea sp. NBRC 105346]|uniref:M23 family metallopeptidase n=1 Tax=Lentzea sp. NBRC 105346 TaxID=3032205 RepID=UPI0024A011E0|nr:M23 family metallopeptidase [Lentzea sp. NBRC 105346]GLZ30024.1 peptidase M23 [Lentzea sp. NBRC 105346]
MKLGKMLSAGVGLAISLGVLTIGGPQANAATNFQMPFPCGQVWEGQTRTNHSPANAVDLNRNGDEGDPVVASASGTVTKVRNEGSTSYGRWIEISHGGGWTTRYAHLSAQRVSVGQNVSQGQTIGNVGNTGGSTGAHLHFEELLNGTPQKIKWDGAQILYWGSKSYKSKNCGGNGNPGNPYSPEEICGDGYKVVDSHAVTGGKVYLLYSSANGNNCVTTVKSTNLGRETKVSAMLQVQDAAATKDEGDYGYYAGPIRKKAPGKCVKWGGQVGTSGGYTSGFEHCG